MNYIGILKVWPRFEQVNVQFKSLQLHLYIAYFEQLSPGKRIFDTSFNNEVYPDQTAPVGAVWSWYPLFVTPRTNIVMVPRQTICMFHYVCFDL